MGRIIDVDSHAEPAPTWLDEFPALRRRLPARLPADDPQFPTAGSNPELFAWFVAADLQRYRPVADRLSSGELMTPFIELIYRPDRPPIPYEGADQHWYLDAANRIAWLDGEGIDVQHVISGATYAYARAIDDPVLAMDTIEAANRWMVDHVGDHIDRIKPVVTLRFDDIDRAIAELTSMRARGCRMFLISGEPTGDIPHYHPSFDRLWAAACDLGMVAMLHVGMGPAAFHPGWANTADPALMKRMATGQAFQAAVTMLNAMVFGGVFERHPTLTMLISEFGTGWFDYVARNIDGRGPGASVFLGDYTLPLAPMDYIRRNVRISPLPSIDQSPVDLLDQYPECLVFSSDYPHVEGNGSPMAHYRQVLGELDESLRDSFMGDSIAECFTRMGDPL